MLAATMPRKKLQATIKPAVLKVLGYQAVAELLRDEVDKRYAAVLASKEYRNDEGERVFDPKYSWRICDEQVLEYYAEIDKANRKAGFTGPDGHCPALIAECNLRDAQRELFDIAAPLFGISYEQIMQSKNCLENYREFIRLLCGLALAKK